MSSDSSDMADSELAERVQEIQLDNSEESLFSEFADLPNILIVTNVAVEIFDDSAFQVIMSLCFKV